MSATTEHLRLFVAVELPHEVIAALGGIQKQFRLSGLDSLRWVRPEGIHLTLKFLGETPAHRVPDIEEGLRQAVLGAPRHSLTLGALGTFGGRQRPQVLWIDVRGDVERLKRLQSQVEARLAQAGFPREDRAFSPHLTIARIRPETAREVSPRIERAISDIKVTPVPFDVTEIALMLSILQRSGAVYRRLCAFPLTLDP